LITLFRLIVGSDITTVLRKLSIFGRVFVVALDNRIHGLS
jgi:hypothetical protein